MGLLDEAIREHLELKRRRGADPSAVAREEREVLAPDTTDEDVHDADDATDDALPQAQDAHAAEPYGGDAHAAAEHAGEHLQRDDRGEERLVDLSNAGQETAEIDMQAVLQGDWEATDSAVPVDPIVDDPPLVGYSEDGPGEESLDWELADERDRGSIPEEIPGQERLTFE
jgi:hypothetical protein